jgi:hypothetical protein
MKYEIQIGEVYDMNASKIIPKRRIIITEEQLSIIEELADIHRDEELDKIYKINACYFKVVPNYSLEEAMSNISHL